MSEPLFVDIGEGEGPAEIESLCMNCHENGITRLLLTKIPHFKEVILMAFECPHCHFKNNEIQSGQAIGEKGITTSCSIKNSKDLNRQVVKSEFATIRIPELDFEIPPTARNGSLTTVEGILQKIVDGLSSDQAVRKYADPENYEKIEEFLGKLTACKDLQTPFSIEVRDPSGNSYIENICVPKADPQITVEEYTRSAEDNEFLGFAEEQPEAKRNEDLYEPEDNFQKGVMEFPTNCSNCNAPVICKMHMIDIPFFKEVIIMAASCDSCGYRTSEVKHGAAIAPLGKKITLKITDPSDLSRDILKSESCTVSIPEIELDLNPGTLGGKFTTIEGLLSQVFDQMKEKNPFYIGDSATEDDKKPFAKFLSSLEKILKGEMNFTLIVDDCLGSSYLQNLYAPDPDPNMTIEEYERTWQQNEDFGLNDMVENPEEQAGEHEEKEEDKEEEHEAK